MNLYNTRFLNGGYCIQLARLTGARSWGLRRYHAVFVSFEHPIHGHCLIDTGYGPSIRQAASTMHERLLSMLLPVPKRQPFESVDYLTRIHGIDAPRVRLVFISHFHIDHVGGLSLFPGSDFVFRHECLSELQTLRRGDKLRNGFFERLIAPIHRQNTRKVCESDFQYDPGLPGLRAFDYFQDGSLLLLDLPGHALGHTGYLLRLANGDQILYAVDAFWDTHAWEKQRSLPWPVHHAIHNRKAYYSTQKKIRELSQLLGSNPVACHCRRTQELHVR